MHHPREKAQIGGVGLGVARHHNREIDCPTATGDPTTNKAFGYSASHAAAERVRERLQQIEAVSPRHKVRKNQAVALEYMITGSPEAMKDSKKAIAYLNAAKKWIEKRHGKGNIVAAYFHGDETTKHLHIICIPVHPETGKLSAGYFVDGREKMVALQTDFFEEVGGLYGLSRGLEKSKAKHMPVRDFWAKVSQPTPRPSLLDFAKAAVGVKVPAVEHLVAKASTAEALATMHVATRKRASAAKRIEGEQNAKARELKGARSALDLQLEVNQLRAKLAEYERPARGGRSCSGSTGNVFDPCSWLTLGNATATVTKSKPRKVRGFGECTLLGGLHSRGYSMTRLHHSIIIVNATPAGLKAGDGA